MTAFIAFMAFYWAFSFLFIAGAMFDEYNDAFENAAYFFAAALFGWLAFPIVLGCRFMEVDYIDL